MKQLLRSIVFLLIILATVGSTGSCFLLPKKKIAAETIVPAGAVAVAIPKRRYGDPEICAVTGESFSIGKSSRSAIFHGRTYFFKDEAALKAFLADPDGYVR